MSKLLNVENLNVHFDTDHGEIHAVRGIDFHINYGETLGIVGESGSGKSVSAKALLKLLPSDHTNIEADSITIDGKEIAHYSEKQMQSIRGNDIAMIFQDPMTSLNPTMTIGEQIMESYLCHHPSSTRAQAKEKTLQLMQLVHIPDPHIRIYQYPHEFSGGQRQRVMIAIALAASPKLIIADEPTTALDVTIQAQILDLLKEIQKNTNMSMIFITHDLSIVANICDRICVMYSGQIIEKAYVKELFDKPSHPYSKLLLGAVPEINKSKTEKLAIIQGNPPNLFHKAKGCSFYPRCPNAMRICRSMPPPPFKSVNNAIVNCWLHHSSANEVEK